MQYGAPQATDGQQFASRLVDEVKRLQTICDFPSERQLALAAGIDPATLNRKLKGRSELNAREIASLAGALGVSAQHLSRLAEAEVA